MSEQKNCRHIKFYVNDVECKQRRNPQTGHVYHNTIQLPVCQQGDELIICRGTCKYYEPKD